MAAAVFSDKRTRSQLTLPDDLLLGLSQGSPLKDARTAFRQNNNQTEAVTSRDEEIVEETDDELLLSPGKQIPMTRTTKRSVSPPPGDEYALRPKSPSERRELKRMKLDDHEISALKGQPTIKTTLPPRSNHSRSYSQPESSKYPTRTLFATTRSSSAEAPSPSVSGETELIGKGRAQSVPLFASSLPSGIMHIDLRKPPPSPRRSKSRSPSKDPELRIISGPAAIAKLDTIQDEVDSNPLSQSVICDDRNLVLDAPSIAKDEACGTRLEEPSPLPSPSKKRPAPLVIVQSPATPVRDASSLSPLTPIPETPLPSSSASEDNQHIQSGLGTSLMEAAPPTPTPPLKPSLGLSVITKSRLPRPSSSTNLALSTKEAPQVVQPIIKSVASSSKQVTIAPKANNAFSVLMANAREKKDQGKAKGKGKGKEKVAIPKTASSSGTGLKTTSTSSKPPGKGPTLDKGKAKEIPPPKPSLKSKMKPKTVPRPKPKPPSPVIPQLPLEVEKEKEPSPPPSSSLPRTPSPVRSTHSGRPTTPYVMDVSMESIGHVVEPDVPMEVDVPVLTEPSHQAARTSVVAQDIPVRVVEPAPSNAPDAPVEPPESDVLVEPHVSVMGDVVIVSTAEDTPPVAEASNASSIVPAEPSNTATSSVDHIAVALPIDPPHPKPHTTKVHLPKRKPSSIPAPTRVTRSVSMKRNQKASEVPKALPVKVGLAKKKSLTAFVSEVVASGSSGKSDEAPSDIVPSNLSTESIDTTLPSGSPIKFGSPTKQSYSMKTPRSSFAKPTRSALAKQVSPLKMGLPKSRGSSPNKLARSVSMTSRPRVSMSRTFSSYSSLEGSSLSTLSSALEKLQQRPPERPNTSMGFNRDDPDSSVELETTSKDDSSIQPSTSNDSKTASSSKEVAVSSSRLIQRTLFSGPRPSLAGKFTVGSLGSGTRGTSGFEVLGQPSKAGPRMFGVGGGMFSGATRARAMQKVSRKTSLPSVMASPVKGGDKGDAMDIMEDDVPQGEGQDPDAIPSGIHAEGMAQLTDENGKGKERATEPWNSDVSQHVSSTSLVLSQSLNASSGKGVGLMGPPATPKGRKGLRSVSSTYPSTSSDAEVSGRTSPTRMSLRLAEKAPETGTSGSEITSTAPIANDLESLKFLKDCVIFVDVRNDDGDDVGSLFVEMLEGVGARILTRVGQTCTHIVFKNGLMSTLNRYRLLRDPKPLVVGIAWVVECVEQRKHIDEAKFLVDLDGINVSGTNKRRRSMLPKLMSHEFEERTSSDVEGDVSMDGSTSSMTLDDDLTPLEKARRRIGAIATR